MYYLDRFSNGLFRESSDGYLLFFPTTSSPGYIVPSDKVYIRIIYNYRKVWISSLIILLIAIAIMFTGDLGIVAGFFLIYVVGVLVISSGRIHARDMKPTDLYIVMGGKNAWLAKKTDQPRTGIFSFLEKFGKPIQIVLMIFAGILAILFTIARFPLEDISVMVLGFMGCFYGLLFPKLIGGNSSRERTRGKNKTTS